MKRPAWPKQNASRGQFVELELFAPLIHLGVLFLCVHIVNCCTHIDFASRRAVLAALQFCEILVSRKINRVFVKESLTDPCFQEIVRLNRDSSFDWATKIDRHCH